MKLEIDGMPTMAADSGGPIEIEYVGRGAPLNGNSSTVHLWMFVKEVSSGWHGMSMPAEDARKLAKAILTALDDGNRVLFRRVQSDWNPFEEI